MQNEQLWVTVLVMIGAIIVGSLIAYALWMLLPNQVGSNKRFQLYKTLYLKYDLGNANLIFTYRHKRMLRKIVPLVQFEANLTDSKRENWHQFIDSCKGGNGKSEDLVIQILQSNPDRQVWYRMSFKRYNEKKQLLYFFLTNANDEKTSPEYLESKELLAYDDFIAHIQKLTEDAIRPCGTLICVNLTAMDHIEKRYSKDASIYYQTSLWKTLASIASSTCLVSSKQNQLWIYRHGLTKKYQTRRFFQKLQNIIPKYLRYEDLSLRVDYTIGYCLFGLYTFQTNIAIKEALYASQSKNNYVFEKSLPYIEYDGAMEKENSANYLDFQALNIMIEQKRFITIYHYVFSLYDGVIHDYYIDIDIERSHFKSIQEAYECAKKNQLETAFIEAGFKYTLDNIVEQDNNRTDLFIYPCEFEYLFQLIGIYFSSSQYRDHRVMFAIRAFSSISENTSFQELKDKLTYYKDKGIRFAYIVDENIKTLSNPIFNLFDFFIIPRTLYGDIKENEKSRLSALKMLGTFPDSAGLLLVDVEDKVEVEILMGEEIDYISGPIIGSTHLLHNKPDIVSIRKLHSLMKNKESIDEFEA